MSQTPDTPLAIGEQLIKPGSFFELAPVPGAGRGGYRNQPASLGALLAKGDRLGQRPLAVWADRTLTFAEAMQRARAIANQLQSRYGVRRGTRVAIAMDQTPEWITSFIGVLLSGGCAVVFDRKALTPEILEASNAQLLLSDMREQDLPTLPVDHFDWTVLSQSPDFDVPLEAETAQPDDEALIAFTSGTTGVPKGAVSTHRAVLCGLMNAMLGGTLAARLSNRKPLTPDRSGPGGTLLLTPFSHVSGYSLLLLQFLTGGRIVVPVTTAYAEIAELIQRERVKGIGGSTPSLFAQLIANHSDPRLETLSTFNIFGTALSGETMKRVLGAFEHATIGTSYGLTEANGPIAMIAGDKLLERNHLAGAIVPTAEIVAIDEAGNLLETGTEGQLCVRGDMLMKGYCNKANAIDRNGWFPTGDLGWVDTEGYVYVSERMGERAEMGEDSALRTLVEDCALACQGVEEAVLTRDLSEGLTLAVTGDTPGEPLDRAVGAAIEAMAEIETAIEVVVLERIPRNAVGKVDRRALRQLVSRIPPSSNGESLWRQAVK